VCNRAVILAFGGRFALLYSAGYLWENDGIVIIGHALPALLLRYHFPLFFVTVDDVMALLPQLVDIFGPSARRFP